MYLSFEAYTLNQWQLTMANRGPILDLEVYRHEEALQQHLMTTNAIPYVSQRVMWNEVFVDWVVRAMDAHRTVSSC